MDTDNDPTDSVTDHTPHQSSPAQNDAAQDLSKDLAPGSNQQPSSSTPPPMQRSPLNPNLPASPPAGSSTVVTAQPQPLVRPRPKRGWKRGLRYTYYRFIRLHSSPSYLARGLAIGVFAGFLPFFGLQVILSVAAASLLRGDRVVAAAATWISNPLTYIPLYSLGFHIGRWMLGSEEIVLTAQTFKSTASVMALGREFAVTLLTGCIVLGLLFGSLSYIGSLYLLKRARRRRGQRRHRHL